MILQFPSAPGPTEPLDLTDIRDTLLMLSLSCALIASPKMSIERAREAARMAQQAAEVYADLVTGMIEQGGVK